MNPSQTPIPTEPRQAPPGWYQNPSGPGHRYWDGHRWIDSYSPPNGQFVVPQKKRRTVLKVMIGVILGGLVLIVGCSALVAGGVNEAVNDIEATGITIAEFRSIEQGATQSAVEAQLGEPEDAQEFESQIPDFQGSPSRSSCIYYPEKGKPLFEGRSFQLCFDGGKLTSKNAY